MAKKWTKEEFNKLVSARLEGIPYSEIDLPGRTEAAMKTKIRDSIKANIIPNPHDHYVKWTNEEDEVLKNLKNSGASYIEISKILSRTQDSIKSRLSKLSARGDIKLKNHPRSTFATKPLKDKIFWTDEQLLELVRKYKTQDNLNYNREDWEVSAPVIHKRFGSWSEALILAGMESNLGGWDKSRETWVYLVDFGEFKKIGITQRSIHERFSGFPEYKILDSVLLNFNEAWELERELIKAIEPYKVIGNLPNGNTECFDYDCTHLEDLL